MEVAMLQLVAIGITVLTGFVGAASVVNAVRIKEHESTDRQRPSAPIERPAQPA
jgi:hypothetical protein